MKPLMELKGVSKSFERRAVLDSIDLVIPRGKVIGLLGKNGAGKTTLLKCALGLLKIDAGAGSSGIIHHGMDRSAGTPWKSATAL